MLKINVSDVTHVCDTVEEAVGFIVATLQKWIRSDDSRPLSITVSKMANKAPPLEISIGEKLTTKEALG